MNKIKRGAGERVFEVFNIILMVCIAIVMLYPMLYVVFASFSDAFKLMAHRGPILYPLDFTVEAYKQMAKNPMILRGYFNTIIVVVSGTFVNIIMTSLGAYFLASKGPMFKKPIMLLIAFTMYFSGGMIPFYFTVKQLGLTDSLLSLIIPGAINTFNLIIMKTTFGSIPEAMTEAALIDGAGHFRILFKVILPLSRATIAVMVLYYGVGHWNSWFNANLFLNKRELFPLQLILREILIQNDTSAMTLDMASEDQLAIGETIKHAVTVVATLPILCAYPFVQKYFEKGVMIGGIKE